LSERGATISLTVDHVGAEVRVMRKQEAVFKLLGLLVVGAFVHRAAGRQAAALGLPVFAVTLGGVAATAALGKVLGE
jgi:hypothetical protein